jgi:hypothetical protein
MMTRSLRTRRLASAHVACAAFVLARAAAAQPHDMAKAATAQALYDQAVAALDKKDFAGACPKLEEVVRLEPAGIGAKITLAECYEGAGKLASAAATYELAEAASVEAGQAERKKKAHDRAAALRPRLAHLTLTVPQEISALPGLVIRRDGIRVGAGQWGVALPADQGEHRVAVTATGKEPWEQAVVVADGTEVTVSVGSLADARGGAAPGPVAPAPDTASGRRIGGIVALSVGGALVTVGAVMLALDLTACDPNSLSCLSLSTPPPYGTFAAVFFAVGAAAAGTGIVLLATLPKAQPAKAAVVPVIAPGYVGVRATF